MFWCGWLTPASASLILPGPITDPVPVFLVMLAVMLLAPLFFERLRLPGMVGLIVAGALIGPHGLGLLQRSNAIVLFGTVGILWLMFMAGLETSPDDLKKGARASLGFGLLTFLLPMGLGMAVMTGVGYSLLASILVASCLASHTLLALPLVLRLGIAKTRPVAATLGATLITNVLALLVLAVVTRAFVGQLTAGFWVTLLVGVSLFTLTTLVGVPRVGRWFFRRFGHDEVAEFSFVLTTLFLISYFAEWVQVEPIVGAFLAGTAITDLIPRSSPLMHRIEFVGNSLFIPIFLISVGMLVDLSLLLEPAALVAAAAIVGAVFVSKYLAAWVAGRLFNFSPAGVRLMFGLSLAQAASTLAAATVAYEVDLIDETTINGIIVMILVTCIVSPWAVSLWGSQVRSEVAGLPGAPGAPQPAEEFGCRRVLVPVSNPTTEDNLLRLAIALLDREGGMLLPIQVLVDHGERPSAADLSAQRGLLEVATRVARTAAVPVQPVPRIDGAVERGILRASFEHTADVIVLGWKGYSSYREEFLGSVIDHVVRRSPAPVLVSRLVQPVQNTRRVILAFSDWNAAGSHIEQELAWCRHIAQQLKAAFTVVHAPRSSAFSLALSAQEVPLVEGDGSLAEQLQALLEADDMLVLSAPPSARFGSVTGGQVEQLAHRFSQTSVVVLCHPELQL